MWPKSLLSLYLHAACISRLETVIWKKLRQLGAPGSQRLALDAKAPGTEGVMGWPGGLFYTSAQQHWQLVLAISCMAASRFWTSRQELMPSEFPLTWATFRVQFPSNNPEEPDRNAWRNQKWKTLRYSFDELREQLTYKYACASVWMNTRWLAVSFKPGSVLGTGASWRIFQTTPDWYIPLLPMLSVWAQLCSIHPWSFFFSEVLSEWIPT